MDATTQMSDGKETGGMKMRVEKGNGREWGKVNEETGACARFEVFEGQYCFSSSVVTA
ncbi:hypothetical protein NQZ68_038238, partial [Dissostichus eleginoides]